MNSQHPQQQQQRPLQPAIIHKRVSSNIPTQVFKLDSLCQPQILSNGAANNNLSGNDPNQQISGVINYFKTSGDGGSLPPIMNRRSTLTHDLRMAKRSRYQNQNLQKQLDSFNSQTTSNRRFESVNMRKSQPLYPGLSNHAASILEASTPTYQSTAASSSLTRSKQQLYRDKMTKEANQLAKIKLAQLRTNDFSMNDTPTDAQLDQEMMDTGANGEIPTRKERKKTYFTNVSQLYNKQKRQWMIKHGKGHFLDFHDDQIRKLRECFDSLDTDGSGAIGVEELEDPLIGLGFAETRQEVLDMISSVDEDGSNMIEFDEFLTIIKGSNANEKTAKINKFFKDMTTGKLTQQDISFNMFVQKMRRGYLKNAIFGHDDPGEKEMGQKILKNIAKQFQQQNLSKPGTKTSGFGLDPFGNQIPLYN